MKIILRLVLILFVGFVAVLAFFLGEAHLEMRGINPALPSAEDIRTALETDEGPVTIRYVNTASQQSPGRETIHPSYVLEWSDGRLFLIDAGMDAEGAAAFGQTMERLVAAEPIDFHTDIAGAMGEKRSSVKGIAYSHLHIDHTGGLKTLCAAADDPITVFQTTLQARKGNYMTDGGQRHIDEAPCVSRQELSDGTIKSVPGFPGLIAVSAGGHTPGSTVYFVRIGTAVWALTGDIALTLEAVRSNEPKPAVYSALVVPEAVNRMEQLRLWLSQLEQNAGFKIVVSHDRLSLVENEMSPISE